MHKPTLIQGIGLATWLSLSASASTLLSCSGQQPPPPPTTCELQQRVHLVVESSDRLNTDDEGRSLPTIVRIYQLKGITKIENAQFEQVWRHAQDTLGDDILGVEEVTMFPGRRETVNFTRKKEANYVVGVAIVRHPAGISWFSSFELPPPPGDERCAALQQNPGSNPSRSPDPRFYFFVEDYHIDGGPDPQAPPEEPGAGGDGGAGGHGPSRDQMNQNPAQQGQQQGQNIQNQGSQYQNARPPVWRKRDTTSTDGPARVDDPTSGGERGVPVARPERVE